MHPALAKSHLMFGKLDKKTTTLLHQDKRIGHNFQNAFFCFRSSLNTNIYMLQTSGRVMCIQKVQKSPFEYFFLTFCTHEIGRFKNHKKKKKKKEKKKKKQKYLTC